MTTDRQFARFDPEKSVVTGRERNSPFAAHEIPDGGMCLSSFVVLNEAGHKNRVLLGHLNPKARWDHIGALDPERVRVHSKGWMIPSSHLLLKESPHGAALRILKEQLELEEVDNNEEEEEGEKRRGGVKLAEPIVVSETYTPKRFSNLPTHWDIEFIFRGELPEERVPKAFAWRELRFVDLGRTSKAEMARSHEDILESAGFRFAKDSVPNNSKQGTGGDGEGTH